MEDLGLSDEGCALFDILDGRYKASGSLLYQIDGGIKWFGHPVGASGLRIAYEVHSQLEARRPAAARRRPLGAHAQSWRMAFYGVAAVAILGRFN